MNSNDGETHFMALVIGVLLLELIIINSFTCQQVENLNCSRLKRLLY